MKKLLDFEGFLSAQFGHRPCSREYMDTFAAGRRGELLRFANKTFKRGSPAESSTAFPALMRGVRLRSSVLFLVIIRSLSPLPPSTAAGGPGGCFRWWAPSILANRRRSLQFESSLINFPSTSTEQMKPFLGNSDCRYLAF
jgi:hypothetical protein